MKALYLVLFVMSVMIIACSDNDSTDETVFDDQLKTMDKARAVEQQLQKSATEQQQQIKEQTDQ